ncbi:MAG TPA: adenylate/guanylate cyclase domain-containing protein [Candidatus Dormibacteraeota bacterium]|nr:adenylate/guanylate cyclase domain-containing protein [Candidatus Dormibacteraeota bacterium]
MSSGAQPQRSARLDAAFAQEVEHGLALAARVRLVALAIIGVWVTIENPYPEFLHFYPYFLLFALFGYLPLLARREGRPVAWVRYLCPLLDMGLFTLLVMTPNPLEPDVLPPQMRLRFGNEIYLFAFIVASAATYSPGLVMWSGVCAAISWSIATLAIVLLPDTVVSIPSHVSHGDALQRAVDPHIVFFNVWGRQVVVFLVTAGSLAALMQRARRLVERQTAAERERANLSRYFSPNLVDELAQTDQPLGPTRQQQVAVLFADLVGFTRLAETLSPPAVIELLREFHGRMQAAVFAHGGTVDKYIGDAVMATFGTPRVGPADATNALRAALAMRDAVAAWNAARTARGAAPVAIGVGVHHGTVVLGDIGGQSRLEFAVLGDAVNVASRLERLTRELGATIVASDDVVAAARREGAADVQSLLAGFSPGAPQTLRGRSGAVGVWVA